MEKKAPIALLLLPLTILIVIIVLIILIITSLNRPATVVVNTTTTNSTQNNTTTTNTNTSTQPTNIQGNSTETNSLDKAINSVPKSGFPDSTCPSNLVLESNGNKFAILSEDKFSISATQLTWIQTNCSDVKTLNY